MPQSVPTAMQIVLSTICILLIAAASSAQSLAEDITLAKSIHLLDASPEDVGKILGRLSPYRNGEEVYARPETIMRVQFSSGKCTDSDAQGVMSDDWNVPKGRAVVLELEPRNPLTIQQIDLSDVSLMKDRLYRGRSDYHIHYNKSEGIAVITYGEFVDSIMLFPSLASRSRLCKDPKIERYYAKREWKRDWRPKYEGILRNQSANVNDLALTETMDRLFTVRTTARDPENDVLTYTYIVTAGKIVGGGFQVIWDLSDAPPGEHSITVGVDDGAGIVGKTVTKTVQLKK